jgi:hypothetical protein
MVAMLRIGGLTFYRFKVEAEAESLSKLTFTRLI